MEVKGVLRRSVINGMPWCLVSWMQFSQWSWVKEERIRAVPHFEQLCGPDMQCTEERRTDCVILVPKGMKGPEYVDVTGLLGPVLDDVTIRNYLFLAPCQCDSCTDCGCINGNYDNQSKIIDFQHIIHECTPLCRCSPDCPNRVVQCGPRVGLVVKHSKEKGWGVYTDHDIEAKTFVAEYLGELIHLKEAQERQTIGNGNYIFDMDFGGDIKFSIDSRTHGNVARFFNHSCAPNLQRALVFYDVAENKDYCRLAFFTLRAIKRGEELCFDYNGPWGQNEKQTEGTLPCKCGQENCRKFVY